MSAEFRACGEKVEVKTKFFWCLARDRFAALTPEDHEELERMSKGTGTERLSKGTDQGSEPCSFGLRSHQEDENPHHYDPAQLSATSHGYVRYLACRFRVRVVRGFLGTKRKR